MIKLEIKKKKKKDTTSITPNIFNNNPSKMEQIILNFILDYCFNLTNLERKEEYKNEK